MSIPQELEKKKGKVGYRINIYDSAVQCQFHKSWKKKKARWAVY